MVEPTVYLNGKFISASEATISIVDRAVVQGATVTEMTRTFDGKPFKLEAHLQRLYRSLEILNIDIRLSRSELVEISLRVLSDNFRAVDRQELALIQFSSPGLVPHYAGVSANDVSPTVCVHTIPLTFRRYADLFMYGARVVVSSVRSLPAECIDPIIKHRSRLHFYLADKEVARRDPGAIALLLDMHGNITETSTANFLVVQDGAVLSPPANKILPGTSRQTVAEICHQLGVPFIERKLSSDDMSTAQEAFLTSTPYCIAPVVHFNGRPIGTGKPGPIFGRIITAWNERVGLDIMKQITEGRRSTHEFAVA